MWGLLMDMLETNQQVQRARPMSLDSSRHLSSVLLLPSSLPEVSKLKLGGDFHDCIKVLLAQYVCVSEPQHF